MSLLTQNGIYGATIGNKTVFTIAGALERYKLFIKHCYNPLTPESASVLSNVQNDMVRCGFTWDEMEKIEAEYFKSLEAK